jgi:TonB-linked SusC/RagA family outer membrane protein
MKDLFKKVCLLSFLILFIGVGQAMGQKRTVTGRVTDAQNEGMPGVSVQLKAGSQGAITNANGQYTISIPTGKAVLVFSFIGYEKQEVTVGNRTTVNVQMQENTKQLDEVVVVAYGTARKKDLTGALTNMRPDENDAAKSISVSNLLEGKVAGLVVNTASSTVGSASSVVIRGASSLRGDNQPLYVIDNIPQASTGEFGDTSANTNTGKDYQIQQDPLAALNPADIEDITILKDASSTAIYGSRGANGVILITTKKGKEGRVKVNASATFTIANATRLLDMMNLKEYAQYVNSRVTTTSENDYQFHIVGDDVRYALTGEQSKYDPNDPETYRVLEYRNWQKEIYRSAFSQNYAMSVSGGTANSRYYVSAGYKDINGTVKNTGIKQGDIRMNLNSDLSKSLKLSLMLGGSIRKNNMMAGGNTLGGSTTALSRTALDYAPFEYPSDDAALNGETKTTIFSWINDYTDLADDKTFNGSFELNWKIIKGLTYSLRTGGNLNTNERKRWYGLQLYQGMNNNGFLGISNLSRSNYTVENLLNYNTTFGKNIFLDATAGITYDNYKFLSKNTQGTNFSMYNFRENGMHMANSVVISAPIQNDYQLLSYLGRVNLNFFEKYLVTASIRADGSSKFAKGKRWGYFPSASIAWRMEQENFLKDISWVSQLKLRLSYGVTGNQSISPYQTFSLYGSSSSYYYADGSGNWSKVMQVTNLANNGLKWEKTGTWNAGLDFSLFRSRLTGSVDVYNKKTTDLLISRNLPGSSGFTSTYYNQGSLTNKGVEVSLMAQIVDKKDWKWSVSGNFGLNRSKIGDLGLLPTDFGSLGSQVGYYGNSLGDHFGVGHIFLAGKAPGLFYGYATQGIIQTSDVNSDGSINYIKKDGTTGTYTKVNGTAMKAGDVKFLDTNEDGVVDTNDRTIIGNPNPDFTYGFQTRVAWKTLSLSASFTGVKGRDILDTGIRYNMTPGTRSGNITSEAFNNMWTPTNATNLYPSSKFVSQNVVMDNYVEDGSYLRCSDITLNYVIPKNWLGKSGIKTLSVYASVKNAFILTNYKGYDPEVNSFAFDGLRPGVDMNAYPTPRQIIFGLNVSF